MYWHDYLVEILILGLTCDSLHVIIELYLYATNCPQTEIVYYTVLIEIKRNKLLLKSQACIALYTYERFMYTPQVWGSPHLCANATDEIIYWKLEK